MSSIITCRGLCVRYDSEIAVKDTTFSVESGDFLCIVGENGAGKSTLMKAILGLVKPTSGSIEYSGIRQTEIGYLPQQTPIQKDFPAGVYEVVISGRQGKGGFFPFYRKPDRAAALYNINRMGVQGFLRKSFRDLSGGQQQRVLLARALCAASGVLMLDEPFTGLDPMAASELYGLLSEINVQGITIIMISHDVKTAVKYGGKILHIKTSPLFFGSTKEYKKSETGLRMLGGDSHF